MINATKLKLTLYLLLFATSICILGWLAQSKSTETIDIQGVTYIAPSAGQGDGSGRATGPIYTKKLMQNLELNTLNISFEFSTLEPTFSYGNLFQTGDSIDAIRMELQPPNNLVLVLGNGKLFQLSNAINLGKMYPVHLAYVRNKFLRIFVDNTEVLNIIDKGILAGPFDISNIVVGTGMARQRTLLGTVQNFNLNGDYNYSNAAAKLSRWILILLCGIAFLKFLPSGFNAVNANLRVTKLQVTSLADNFALFGFALALIAIGLFSINFLGEHHLGLSKWIAHLTLPASLVLIILVIKQQWDLWKYLRWPLGILFLAYVVSIVFSLEKKPQTYNAFILGVLMFSIIAFGLLLIRQIRESRHSQGADSHTISVTAAGFASLVLVFSWSTLVDLTNWSAFKLSFDNHFGFVVVGAFLILHILFSIIFGSKEVTQPSAYGSVSYKKITDLISHYYLDIAIIAVFFWISFRIDSLFIPGSEYHWEYFVGVVQGIKNGGWLLWDTPSQYGFLNILIASLVPSKSPWQSFYIFQGALLFLVSTGIYLAGRRHISASIFQRLALFAMVFMALFFADPELIGPYPFPSSSVVRFFCVYALLLVVWFIPKFGIRQAVALSIAWSLSILWSAESAIYGTSIFIFVLVALLQTETNINDRITLAVKYIATAATCVSLILVILFVFYFEKLGISPDFYSFFEHAVGYAEGFGYVPFSLFGPGNFLLLVFMGISILCIRAIRSTEEANQNIVAPLAAMAGCIWGISTYYIGRPVPQNITAMLPLIVMVVYLTLILAKRMVQNDYYSLLIKAAALPLFFLILIPVFNLKWISNLPQIESFSSDISARLPQASDELLHLLLLAKATPSTPIVYYGDDAAPPVFSGDYKQMNSSNWLPIPLQLLEIPISEQRRSIYLNRYICRLKPEGGVLINRKSETIEIRLKGFLNELRNYYDDVEVFQGKAYAVYRFSGINTQRCSSGYVKKS